MEQIEDQGKSAHRYTPYKRKSYAVWEITLKCNLACSHCGSRAGDERSDELTTEEAFDLIHQMAEVGIEEITLIGGEAFLRADWLDLAREINRCGMMVSMTTGGYGISRTTAERMKEAGIAQVSVSVDGLESIHDHLRGKKGSWAFCFQTMEHLKEVGIVYTANSQVNRHSAREFPMLYELLRNAGIWSWQIQMTVPMGNAADSSELLLRPSELLDFYPVLAYVTRRGNQEGVMLQPGNNIGYYGPYERLIRGLGQEDNTSRFWAGCQAGLRGLGIEANGVIKGCPSLPTTAYTGGNIRDMKLKDIIMHTPELNINAQAGTPEGASHLWGFCKGCEFAMLCRGGCNWTSHVFFDKRGNNPYCHHRALSMAGRGLRERFRPKELAPGIPFDNGVFELFEETLDAPWPEEDTLHFTLDDVQWPTSWLEADPQLPDRIRFERDTILQIYQEKEQADKESQ